MSQPIALIIEDTDANRIFFERFISQVGFKAISACNGKDALQMADTHNIALAVVDMELGDVSGLEMLYRLRLKFPQACLIMATMHDSPTLIESAFTKGADIYLVKPHGFMELFKLVSSNGYYDLHTKDPIIIDQYGARSYHLARS